MSDGGPPTVLICCSVLRREMEIVRDEIGSAVRLDFVDSGLHMAPEHLAAELEVRIASERKRGARVLLVYGDCCPQMADLAARPGVARTCGKNCCELLLGCHEYKRLSHEGAYFLLAEWAPHWPVTMTACLGLEPDVAAALMQDMHTKLVYVDTGVADTPTDDLNACAQYAALPWSVQRTSLAHLRAAVETALLELEWTGEVR